MEEAREEAPSAAAGPNGEGPRQRYIHTVSFTPYTEEQIDARMIHRGVNRSEAIRQFVDEANGRYSYRGAAIRTTIAEIIARCEAVARESAKHRDDMARIIQKAHHIAELT